MEFQKQQLDIQLQKIIESYQFSRSGVNISLLTLLYGTSLEGRKLKEATIGAEIFGRRYDPIKNDTKVRVYIHNLRKKLAEYYETSGVADEIIFEIEKGQYQVTFREKERPTKAIGFKEIILIAAILLLMSVSAVFFFGEKKAIPLWSGIAQMELPATVLIGDHFTIETEVKTGNRGVFRDFSINSKQEFAEYVNEHPEQAQSLLPNRYPYITKMGVFCPRIITEFFTDQEIPFDLMLMSEWDKTKINSEHVVYIGQFKTMGFLKELFHENNPEYKIKSSGISVYNQKLKQEIDYNSHAGDQLDDYTLVSHFKGYEGNDIILFASDHDVGVIRLVDYFTTADSLAAFYGRHHLSEDGFTAVFKVTGWDRTGTNMELISVESK